MTKHDERFEQQLRDAVRAPALPPAFEVDMGQMIDRLPRKEQPVMKRKISVGLAVAVILCLLTVGAVAVALLTNQELVEQELIPMAQQNDADGLNDTFTHEELGYILALAEENGISLAANQNIQDAWNTGKGYWEEEVIMAIAKDAFGPYPGQWTLEEQYWFEEVVVAIGFKDVNYARIPGEGDLPYGEAYALAKAHIADEYSPSEAALLDDRSCYDLWRGYHAYPDESGQPQAPTWYFWFEPKDIALTEYELTLDQAGGILTCKVGQTLQSLLDNTDGGVTALHIRDRFESCYGTIGKWSPETWVLFASWLDKANDADEVLLAQGDYRLPPEGALTQEEAFARALEEAGEAEYRPMSAVCMQDRDHTIWKVTLRDAQNGRLFIELDCLTGAILFRGRTLRDVWYAPYLPTDLLLQQYQAPDPDGLG